MLFCANEINGINKTATIRKFFITKPLFFITIAGRFCSNFKKPFKLKVKSTKGQTWFSLSLPVFLSF
jgi:hypothetical protein